jgi:hypothetical protein
MQSFDDFPQVLAHISNWTHRATRGRKKHIYRSSWHSSHSARPQSCCAGLQSMTFLLGVPYSLFLHVWVHRRWTPHRPSQAARSWATRRECKSYRATQKPTCVPHPPLALLVCCCLVTLLYSLRQTNSDRTGGVARNTCDSIVLCESKSCFYW